MPLQSIVSLLPLPLPGGQTGGTPPPGGQAGGTPPPGDTNPPDASDLQKGKEKLKKVEKNSSTQEQILDSGGGPGVISNLELQEGIKKLKPVENIKQQESTQKNEEG